jgi:uncharacterized protein (TIGR02284 family)
MSDYVIDILETLIQTSRDGQEGYRSAAESTGDAGLKTFFEHQSLQRASFAGELENEVQHLGKADPDRSASVLNKLHRAWFDLKKKMGGGDLSVLESVESGEDSAKQHYQEALDAGLPNDVRDIVQRQAQSVIAAHDKVRTLRDQYKRAA